MKKLLLIALAAVLVVAFCAPAMAATKKVSFYGDVRFNTYWVKADEDYYAFARGNTTGDTDSDLLWELDNADSRFGARFAEGPISANVELRPNSGSIYRQWWAQWDMGPAQLLIGHTYTPACIAMDMSQFDSESGVVYGDLMVRLRTTQVRLTVPFSMGKFVIAAQDMPENLPELKDANAPVAPKASDYATSAAYLAAVSAYKTAAAVYAFDNPSAKLDTDHSLPELEACLTLKIAPVQLDLFGGYYTYDVVDVATEDSEDVTSTLWGLRVILPIGPLYVKGQYYKMTNPGSYGDISTSLQEYRVPRWDMTDPDNIKTDDVDYTGYGAVVGFKVNDMVTVEAGYFASKTERYLQEEDPISTYYLVAAVTPIKGVTIYPEIGIRDEKDVTDAAGKTTDEGKRSYIGAYWKIAF